LSALRAEIVTRQKLDRLLRLAAEIDADHDLVVWRTPALQDVECACSDAAEIDKDPRRLVGIDHLLDPIRARDSVDLGTALDLTDLPTLPPGKAEPIVSETCRIGADYQRAPSSPRRA
jgi:hypothetical protein